MNLLFVAVPKIFSCLRVPYSQPIIVYSCAYIAASLLFILICKTILKHEISPGNIFALVMAGLVLRLVLIPVHPIGSDDYYRYLWDGKVIAHGMNPYRYAPTDPALESLHSKSLPSKINFADMKTIYPPLAEIIFYVSYQLGGENFVGLKLLLLIFDLATVWGMYLIIKRLNFPPKNILFYLLCPLPLFELFVDGHMDGFGVPFLVFGILFYMKDRKLWSYVLIGLSICVKPLGFIVLPLLFFSEKKLTDRLKAIFVPIAICIAAYLPFIFSGSPFQALMNFTENWTFNGIVFDILNLFFNDNQRTRLICAVLFLLAYALAVFNRKDFLSKIYLSIFLLMIFSPVVHPWYLCWLAFLIPLNPRWSGIAYVSLISLTSFTVITYQLTGVWKDYPAVLVAEYVPVLALFALEIANKLRPQWG